MVNLIYALLIICSLLFSEKLSNSNDVLDILNKIISNYERNTSFRLDIYDGKINTILDVDIVWLVLILKVQTVKDHAVRVQQKIRGFFCCTWGG